MSTQVIAKAGPTAMTAKDVESLLMVGNLSTLSPEGRIAYYRRRCEDMGLDPLARPFDYLVLNGKTVLYANKGCFEQLRASRKISIVIASQQKLDDLYVVVARAVMPDGRSDEDTGAVDMAGLKGEKAANAILKAITKAKRRVTLSICGLGMLDETEVDSIAGAQRVQLTEDGQLIGESGTVAGHVYLTAWKGEAVTMDGHTFKAGSHEYCPACKKSWDKLSDAERNEEMGIKAPVTPPQVSAEALPVSASNSADSEKREFSSPAAPATSPDVISEAQRKRLFAIAKESGWKDAERKKFLEENGYKSSSEILKADYERVCNAIMTGRKLAEVEKLPF